MNENDKPTKKPLYDEQDAGDREMIDRQIQVEDAKFRRKLREKQGLYEYEPEDDKL